MRSKMIRICPQSQIHFFFSSVIIINLNTAPMSSQNSLPFALLKPITPSILQEVEQAETSLVTHVKIEGKYYDMALVEDTIIVYSEEKDGSVPLGYALLDFSLKFERIFQTKNFNERVLRGFKLMNDYEESVSFYIDYLTLSQIWISNLSKILNEIGFHNFYKPVRTLGKGSSATVYEVVRLEDGKRFAAKVFPKENIKNNQNKMRSLINELDILRNIQHPNIVKLQGVFESEHSFYVIIETLGGGNMLEYLLKRKSDLSTEQIKTIIKSVLEGLSELEDNGIVHRDIKLQNLMLPQKNSIQPVIVDFGLAIYQDDQDYIYYQCGTPGYISPQVLSLKKGEKITSKSDIFSVGVLLHILLTGRYLFEGTNLKQVFQNNKLLNFDLEKASYAGHDQSLFELMKLMLEKDHNLRPSAKECLIHSSLINQSCDSEEKVPGSPQSTNILCHF